MVDGGLEWGDVCGGVVGNITMERDEAEEVLVYVFFLGVPKLLVVLVNDCVLVRMTVGCSGADGGGKELGEKSGGNRVRRWFDGKRWERSRWLWSGGTGRRYSVDGCSEDGLR